MNKERIAYIDLFRAFGIICMVMGHIGFGTYFDHYIHAYHMPMFYFVSGFFFKDKDVSYLSYVKKKATTLLIPYVFWGIFHMVLDYLKTGCSLTALKSAAFHLVWENTDHLPIAGALWFLTSIFFADIIYLAIYRGFKRTLLRSSVLVILSILGCVWTLVIPFRLPWALDTALAGLGFYYMGYLYRTYLRNRVFTWLGNCPMLILIVGLLVNGVLIFCNGYVNMREGTYALIPLTYINAFSSCVLYWNVTARVDTFSLPLWGDRIKSCFIMIGKESIVFLVTNQIVILILNKVVSVFYLPKFVAKLFVLFISMLVMYGLALFFTKTSFSILIGKKRKIVMCNNESNH